MASTARAATGAIQRAALRSSSGAATTSAPCRRWWQAGAGDGGPRWASTLRGTSARVPSPSVLHPQARARRPRRLALRTLGHGCRPHGTDDAAFQPQQGASASGICESRRRPRARLRPQGALSSTTSSAATRPTATSSSTTSRASSPRPRRSAGERVTTVLPLQGQFCGPSRRRRARPHGAADRRRRRDLRRGARSLAPVVGRG